MEIFETKIAPGFDIAPIVKHYTTVNKEKHNIPDKIAEQIILEMERAAASIS